ncbi:HlyD family secretion protein [Spirochaeta cellobiosiphila]|uniref:HlyD family secretion protein n=1 Tax=Spirochaeta cellobiosiphila TaxID=504483 RepID=UPI000415DE66|nr:HlyD family secretion protein [Spirochaeta cellobiosiphila]
MEKEKKGRKEPKIVSRIIVIIVVLAVAAWGITKTIDTLKYVSTDDASIDGKQFNLSSKMLGRISKINVKEGDKVNAGDILIELDSTDLKAQQTQAQASLVYARKNLLLAQINQDKASDDYDRIKGLYKSGATTKESYDHAVSALEAAKAQYNVMQAQVDTSQAQIGVIEAQLMNTRIPSQIDGIIDTIEQEEGDVVQPSQTILTVNNLDKLWVIANIKETKINRIKEGATVRITVDALPHQTLLGSVDKVYPGIVAPAFQIGEFTKTTQRVPVKIQFHNIPSDFQLLPGLSVEVKVEGKAQLF